MFMLIILDQLFALKQQYYADIVIYITKKTRANDKLITN